MGMNRWLPSTTFTRQEQCLLKRLTRTRKLFSFLRLHRSELFDDAFQDELESMYRDTGAGKEAVPPALLAMVLLLQGYQGISDAEAVEMTVVDLRWQLVLDVLGATEPAFSQGALCAFRARLIEHDMDRRLLERTVELARRTKEFDWKRLPKDLRVAVDSMPLEGTGRVEDTINLLAHAARKAIVCVAALLNHSPGFVAYSGRAPLLAAEHSIKRALDTEWSDAEQKAQALRDLVEQVDSLERWVCKHLPDQVEQPRCPVTSLRCARSASKISSRIPPVAARVSATGGPRSAASRSKTVRCATTERARASGSTATSVISPPTSTAS